MKNTLTEKIATLAVSAILDELHTTPKPGLVDLRNNGSHSDMDLHTFVLSTNAISEYIYNCAALGTDCTDEKELFIKIRREGVSAEKDMLNSTGNINTHKGMIFTMGLFTAAVSYSVYKNNYSHRKISNIIAKMCLGITRELYLHTPSSYGEKLFKKYGLTGVRGLAESGYPQVFNCGLSALNNFMNKTANYEQAKIFSLYNIMSILEDTNIVGRNGLKALLYVQELSKFVINRGFNPFDIEVLEQVDDILIHKNISPGGSADLLAATIFIYNIDNLLRKDGLYGN